MLHSPLLNWKLPTGWPTFIGFTDTPGSVYELETLSSIVYIFRVFSFFTNFCQEIFYLIAISYQFVCLSNELKTSCLSKCGIVGWRRTKTVNEWQILDVTSKDSFAEVSCYTSPFNISRKQPVCGWGDKYVLCNVVLEGKNRKGKKCFCT